MKKQLIKYGFLLAAGEILYIFLVALVFQNANHLFGNTPGILGFITFLMLFVLSAAVSGALILGKPILLYLEGQKREALELFGLTLGWMFVFMLILILVIII